MPTEREHTQPAEPSANLRTMSEEERLRQDIYRPDRDKLRLFTQMLKMNSLFSKAKVVHK
jgi:hypothetical protein